MSATSGAASSSSAAKINSMTPGSDASQLSHADKHRSANIASKHNRKQDLRSIQAATHADNQRSPFSMSAAGTASSSSAAKCSG
jgi:hypothetical protein